MGATATLYIILFPGEGKDNTGIKDLNDKVLGQWWAGEYMQRRYDAIASIFDAPGDAFAVVAQTYKTAFILTYEKDASGFCGQARGFGRGATRRSLASPRSGGRRCGG